MEFSEVLNLIVSSCPFLSGNEYDGIIIKKLAATNTISDTGASHQSHMAFTGRQKDFFPFLNADGYFNVGYESKDDDLKKYFTLQIPLTIYKENTDALTNKLFNLIDYTSGKKVVKASVLRSRRNNADDQIELSIKSLDDKDFIEFRKLLRVDDFFVLLKKKNCLEYDLVGIRSNDKNAEKLSKCTDFYKLPTQTPVGMECFETNENDLLLEIPIETNNSLSESDLAEILANDKELKGTYAIHLFGIKYAKLIQEKNLDKKEIIRLSNIGENYFYELAKGIGIYNLAVDEKYLRKTQLQNLQADKELLKKDSSSVSPSATSFTSPEQIIFYGVPGSGKSHEIKHKLEEEYKIPEEKQDLFVERTVFHPEYTNADFIGQIMPKLVQGKTDFVFKPGPFTSILKKALCDSQNRYVLIIEEINRGNAAAIFGELFQLLDRIDAASKTTSHDGSLNTYGKGWSEYFVMNSEINNYIRDSDDTFDGKALDINGIHFSANTGIRLPPNLSILATMNTSDQNVFTLDNAFQRRWDMKLIENVFRDTEEETNQRNAFVDSAKQITWEKFQTAINIKIGKMSEDAGLSSMEDKRLGCWFVKAEKTTEKDKDGKDIYIIRNELFAEKVLKYLWDDAFKFCREKVFNGYTNLESLTCDFKGEKEFDVFKNLFSETEN
ncbi:MAG: AAA family ATPase [Treponema sp.]|uniref:HTH-like domain-containing protein n=1 Tax=Treponema sp. TaxID=166 RepID=UPI00257EF05B|nr:AAA family ATPase [Treponema sp.]MBQ9103124.1 AAA family ATPase [Treponema sp.]